jgi:hypothetical protein
MKQPIAIRFSNGIMLYSEKIPAVSERISYCFDREKEVYYYPKDGEWTERAKKNINVTEAGAYAVIHNDSGYE